MQKSLFKVITIVLFCSLILGGLSVVATARPLGATSPTLGDSATFSVLAGTAITNTGTTTISGDVGVSPGTSITGFESVVLGGTQYAGGTEAANAQADNLIVFGELDQDCDQTYGAVDLATQFPGGVGPGVYCSTSSFSLTGNLNLIGEGVWIFKTVSGLTINSGASVTGGDPCNVWWRVGSTATLGAGASFIGNIFALTSVTLADGATLNGRAFAQTAEVTLIGNTIQSPICAIQPVETATATTAPTEEPQESSPTNTPVVPGLPDSGGAPIQSDAFPWGITIIGIFSVLAMAIGIRAYRATNRLKQ
ncbi:MAG TPA: ice-binding family protein [Anaerolineaceae bacterium]|nr:ice-binding family protein [Anaerolineaceae bacterium]